MPASSDAVSDDHEGRPPRRPSWRVLLTLAVLCLIYQQVPLLFGAIAVKTWLHYALPILGGLLLAQSGKHAAQSTWSQLQRAARQIKKLTKGFSVTYDPNRAGGGDRDSEHLLDEERSDGADH